MSHGTKYNYVCKCQSLTPGEGAQTSPPQTYITSTLPYSNPFCRWFAEQNQEQSQNEETPASFFITEDFTD